MRTTKTYRMQLSTYRKIKRVFPAKKNECVADYFERLANALERLNE